jgi:hypothetical protein
MFHIPSEEEQLKTLPPQISHPNDIKSLLTASLQSPNTKINPNSPQSHISVPVILLS